MVFLSRFGLYRNLTILAAINAVATIWMNRADLFSLAPITSVIGVFAMHMLLYSRARQFYYYAGNEVLRNFILSAKAPV